MIVKTIEIENSHYNLVSFLWWNWFCMFLVGGNLLHTVFFFFPFCDGISPFFASSHENVKLTSLYSAKNWLWFSLLFKERGSFHQGCGTPNQTHRPIFIITFTTAIRVVTGCNRSLASCKGVEWSDHGSLSGAELCGLWPWTSMFTDAVHSGGG